MTIQNEQRAGAAASKEQSQSVSSGLSKLRETVQGMRSDAERRDGGGTREARRAAGRIQHKV